MAYATSTVHPLFSIGETLSSPSLKTEESPIKNIWERASEDRISHDEPKKLEAVEEDDPVLLSPLAHSSDSDNEDQDLPLKVKFCVNGDPSFTFKGTHLLSKKGDQITDLTPFFFIHMVHPNESAKYNEEFREYAKCSHICQIPAELVKRALESNNSIKIVVDTHTVEIEFSEEEGLTKDKVLDKIQKTAANQGLVPREISEDDIESLENNTILTF